MRGIVAGLGVGMVLIFAGCMSAAAQQAEVDEPSLHAWPDDPRGTAWFAAGGYALYARTPDRFVAIRAPIADVPHDVLVSATFHKVGGPPGGGYGLIFGDQGVGAGDGVDQDGQFVVAEVSDHGQLGIWRRDGQRWVDIVPWAAAAAVRLDTAPNDLTIQVVNDRLVLHVNGRRVADFAVAGVPLTGRVGIFTGGDLNQVVVEHFQVNHVELLAAPSRSTDPRTAAAPARPAAPPPRPQQQEPPPQSPPFGPAQPGVPVSGLERVRALLGSIASDIAAIFGAFSQGIDSPHSPLNDPSAQRDAKASLDSATRTAGALAAELDQMGIHDGSAESGR